MKGAVSASAFACLLVVMAAPAAAAPSASSALKLVCKTRLTQSDHFSTEHRSYVDHFVLSVDRKAGTVTPFYKTITSFDGVGILEQRPYEIIEDDASGFTFQGEQIDVGATGGFWRVDMPSGEVAMTAKIPANFFAVNHLSLTGKCARTP